MKAEFLDNGYTLETMHLPDRKKPLLVLSLDGRYKAHAVFKDDGACVEFEAFMVATWGPVEEAG